jgi:hypothetical protein
MRNDPLKFVLISFSCNFWGLTALRALLDSAAACGVSIYVDVVHNGKSNDQINHFRSCAGRCDNSTVAHVTAYEDVFQLVENYAEFPGTEFNRHLRHHGLVLSWLIKYWLPVGRHYFLDHDAIANLPFAGWLSGIASSISENLFVFPRYHQEPKSLTAPMFMCDTSVRERLAQFCDLGWTTGVVAYQRQKVSGGSERFYTDHQLERDIRRDFFDDTLHNVVRFLLSRWPEIAQQLAVRNWEHLQHVSFGGDRPIVPAQVRVIDEAIMHRFQPEYFSYDRSSLVYGRFEEHLKKIGLFDKFRTKFLQ